ncbi:hypothetical protein [Pseudomonas cannabina]|uniref:Uncharacterized protein n=1 Tax=Pseudomonas cannabina TaxID=86840 RepID=A0A0P9MC79_PSECA|nr:hypothetical protein [Pseudomonas cannabina]KPW66131.1 hypothetical protein ALO81_200213 [Pseudomonas cannabina]
MKKIKRFNRAVCIALFPLAALAGNAFADSGSISSPGTGSASAGTGSAQSSADDREAAAAAAAAAANPPCSFIVGRGLVCG